MGFHAPDQMPSGAPGRKFYGWLVLLVSMVVVLATGLENARNLPSTIMEACRAYRICSPAPIGPLADLQTPYMDGIGGNAAAQPLLDKYRSQYPDYNISFNNAPDRERGSCDNAFIKKDCKYSYGGTFTAQPKWHGVLAFLGL